MTSQATISNFGSLLEGEPLVASHNRIADDVSSLYLTAKHTGGILGKQVLGLFRNGLSTPRALSTTVGDAMLSYGYTSASPIYQAGVTMALSAQKGDAVAAHKAIDKVETLIPLEGVGREMGAKAIIAAAMSSIMGKHDTAKPYASTERISELSAKIMDIAKVDPSFKKDVCELILAMDPDATNTLIAEYSDSASPLVKTRSLLHDSVRPDSQDLITTGAKGLSRSPTEPNFDPILDI